MIAHILLIKEREDLTAGQRAEVEAAIQALERVESVHHMTWGRNFSDRSMGFTYGAVLHFSDSDALARYAVDLDHQRSIAVFRRLTLERLIVDYETGMSAISTD
jgi:hypothetical protein